MTEVTFDEQRITLVTVIYEPSQADPEAIVQAIEMRGDKVSKMIQGGGD
ncbi:MAG: hypothetical protein HYY01_05020 [Chloroflexi bacterium]|nr:hypothetical protein [Chloroflexota bacterium]